MKKIAEVTAFLVIWCLMIAMGIRAGKNHGDCRECAHGHSRQNTATMAVK